MKEPLELKDVILMQHSTIVGFLSSHKYNHIDSCFNKKPHDHELIDKQQVSLATSDNERYAISNLNCY